MDPDDDRLRHRMEDHRRRKPGRDPKSARRARCLPNRRRSRQSYDRNGLPSEHADSGMDHYRCITLPFPAIDPIGKIYEKDSIEVNRKFDKIDEEAAARFNFENCYGVESGNFSKLGDKGWLDSSSVSGEGSFCGIIGKTYFSISFDNGKLSPDGRFGRTRCVRQDDQDACETATKYNTIYYWNFYIENFPEGKCSAEAKKAVDKLSCEEARKENSSYDWENYLKEFPEGQCAAEAKAFLDKEAAKEDSEIK